MAHITAQRTGFLLRNAFEIIMSHGGEMRAKDVLAKLVERVPPTEFEASENASGGRRYEGIVRFASVDTTKAGWMLKTKGMWSVTDMGRKAYGQFTDPAEFYREANRLYRVWKDSQPEQEPVKGDEAVIETEVLEHGLGRAFEESEESAWQEIERFLQNMQPYDFQELVADLLKGMGYHVAWVAPPGRDGGMDILAFQDPIGARPPRIKVQVKRQQASVSVEGMRSFIAVLNDEDVGIFVNIGGFTRDAQEAARNQANRRVTLVDLERLFDLWVEHYDRLSDAARRRMPLKPIWFLAPQE